MGGDHAPAAVVDGACRAVAEGGVSILLVGDRPALEAEIERHGTAGELEIVHASEVVGMDEPATTPIRRKRDSSIRVCAELVKAGDAEALVTVGNTGAAMAAAKVVIGTIAGVDRPALAAVFPNRSGRTVVLDVGANVDSRSSHRRQFAVMGHFYAQEVLGASAPRVGLMSIGEEDNKGTEFTREVFSEMKASGLNFVGNVEGQDVFNGTVDVVVCDGFVCNVILKGSEQVAELYSAMVREELTRSWRTRLGYRLARPAFASLRRRTDYREYGAAPLLGIRGGCFVGHGRSDAKAVRSSIRRAVEFATARLHHKIEEKIAELHAQEDQLRRRVERREAQA